MESQEKILVFCSREICYLSGNFFAHQLAAAFDDEDVIEGQGTIALEILI